MVCTVVSLQPLISVTIKEIGNVENKAFPFAALFNNHKLSVPDEEVPMNHWYPSGPCPVLKLAMRLLSKLQIMVSAAISAVGLVSVICTATGSETQPLISVAVIVAVKMPLPTKV